MIVFVLTESVAQLFRVWEILGSEITIQTSILIHVCRGSSQSLLKIIQAAHQIEL